MSVQPGDSQLAILSVFFDLVRVLHKSGAIDIDDLVAEIGDSIDFRRKEHYPDNLFHVQIYDHLLALAPQVRALSESRAKRTPP